MTGRRRELDDRNVAEVGEGGTGAIEKLVRSATEAAPNDLIVFRESHSILAPF